MTLEWVTAGVFLAGSLVAWIVGIIRQSAKDRLRREIAERDALRMTEAAKGIYEANAAHERRLRVVVGNPLDDDLSRMLSQSPDDPTDSTPHNP